MTSGVNFEQRKQQLVKTLTEQLSQVADPKTKKWFDNYLKGAIEYRGVKTPAVTKLVSSWRQAQNLDKFSLEEQLSLCEALIQSQFAEDKFSGTIYMQKYLCSELAWQQLVPFCSDLFAHGYFYDWSTTDWFCVRVLDPIILRHGLPAAAAIANWCKANKYGKEEPLSSPFATRSKIANIIASSDKSSKSSYQKISALFKQVLAGFWLICLNLILRRRRHYFASISLSSHVRSLIAIPSI